MKGTDVTPLGAQDTIDARKTVLRTVHNHVNANGEHAAQSFVEDKLQLTEATSNLRTQHVPEPHATLDASRTHPKIQKGIGHNAHEAKHGMMADEVEKYLRSHTLLLIPVIAISLFLIARQQ